MKRTWKVIMMALVFGLIVSGCGSKGETTQSDVNNSAVSTNTEQKTEKSDSKENKQDNDLLGKIEFIGEKTKKIGRFEITLEEGVALQKLELLDEGNLRPNQQQFLKIKAKITAIDPKVDEISEYYEFSVYKVDETNFGDDNYIGYATGVFGEQLEASLRAERSYVKNVPKEGYLYFDVPEGDEFRIVYRDDFTQMDYWDIKITK
ncbi:hypothetical protein ABN764_16125 [Paenibacillaceae sp. P-4]|uniref:hypothetical protein n=1 Tax=Paenibacillaceae bacterium P-4 TaxID=3160969 RepID=UPI0032E846AD